MDCEGKGTNEAVLGDLRFRNPKRNLAMIPPISYVQPVADGDRGEQAMRTNDKMRPCAVTETTDMVDLLPSWTGPRRF